MNHAELYRRRAGHAASDPEPKSVAREGRRSQRKNGLVLNPLRARARVRASFARLWYNASWYNAEPKNSRIGRTGWDVGNEEHLELGG